MRRQNLVRLVLASLAIFACRGVAALDDGPPVVVATHASNDPLLREASELPGFVMFRESGAPGLVSSSFAATDRSCSGSARPKRATGTA